jgi:hypothetical protein
MGGHTNSDEFIHIFTSFEHTAYRLETLQRYDVSNEKRAFEAFLAGLPQPPDPAHDEWAGVITAAARAARACGAFTSCKSR